MWKFEEKERKTFPATRQMLIPHELPRGQALSTGALALLGNLLWQALIYLPLEVLNLLY